MGDSIKPRGLILVVDDDAELREMYGDLLGSQNYRFALACDGEVGLRLVQELRPDVVLLDMMMPDCDGLEFLARLPQECSSGRPPVIASSGFDAFEEEALARGSAVFLKKPIDSSELLVILDDLISGKAPEPESLARLGEHAQAVRQRASVRREELWTKFDLNVAAQRLRLEALVRRMSNYFAPATVLVTLVKEGDLLVLASSGDVISAGTVLEHEASLCADVAEGGSSLILGDSSTHACFATHPGAQSGYRFYACVPLIGSEGITIGTLSLQDRQPRVFHAEDLLILEQVGHGVARRMEALAGFGTVGPFIFDEPGIFSRSALHFLLGAELGRSARHGGTVELALIELDQERPALVEQCAFADGGPLGGERFAVANYGTGVLALLQGAGDHKVVKQRIEQALEEIRRSGAVIRGAGLVTYALSGGAALGEREVAHLADEARLRAVSTGSGVEHVVLSSQSGEEATRDRHVE